MKIRTLYLIFVVILLGCNSGTKTPIDQLNDVVIVLNEAPSFEYIAYYNIKQDGATRYDTTTVYIEKSS